MAGGGLNAEEDAAVVEARAQVNAAMGTMQQNMQQMAERDIQLRDMGEKTDRFANTSARFAQQSKQLHLKMQFQRYSLYALFAVLTLEFLC